MNAHAGAKQEQAHHDNEVRKPLRLNVDRGRNQRTDATTMEKTSNVKRRSRDCETTDCCSYGEDTLGTGNCITATQKRQWERKFWSCGHMHTESYESFWYYDPFQTRGGGGRVRTPTGEELLQWETTNQWRDFIWKWHVNDQTTITADEWAAPVPSNIRIPDTRQPVVACGHQSPTTITFTRNANSSFVTRDPWYA